jgi:hypothetical protein
MSDDKPGLPSEPDVSWAFVGFLVVVAELLLLALLPTFDRYYERVATAIVLWAILGIPVVFVVAILMSRRRFRADIPTSATPERPRFRFSLWTLFAAVTVTALLLYPLSWIQQRHAILARGSGSQHWREDGGTIPILLLLFFEPGYYSVVIRFYADNAGERLTPDQQREVQRAKKLFPEATHVRGVVFSSALDPGQ